MKKVPMYTGNPCTYCSAAKALLKTKNGILYSNLSDEHTVRINMGMPNFKWNEIPLSKEMDYKNLNIKISSKDGKEIAGGFSLNVGNPHVVFFVENVDNFNLNEIGPKIERNFYHIYHKCILKM